MLNYEVDPNLLAPLVPRGTELDSWNGTAYASMVGFLFLNTKVLGIPVPLHRDFEEVNLRFYVRCCGPEGWKRGVVFVKEIVPKRAIAAVARRLYDEPYSAMPMRHRVEDGVVEYSWRHRGRWDTLRAVTEGEPSALLEGSEEEFITEHYWGYTARRGGDCAEYGVEYPPWKAWRAKEAVLDCDVAALYGKKFAEPLSRAPLSAFVAEGSPVVVRQGVTL